MYGLFGGSVRREPPGRPATVAARRRLAESAREILALEPGTLGLRETARRVGFSPYHLSRVFHQEMGLTLTARVRARTEGTARAAGGLSKDLQAPPARPVRHS